MNKILHLLIFFSLSLNIFPFGLRVSDWQKAHLDTFTYYWNQAHHLPDAHMGIPGRRSHRNCRDLLGSGPGAFDTRTHINAHGGLGLQLRLPSENAGEGNQTKLSRSEQAM